MADGSAIEWTDATWNPVVGCSVVSPGCTHCYAMKLAGGRLRHHPSRAGLTQPSKAGPVWTGKVRLWEPWLTQPLAWTTPRRIFVCAHGDLFHEDVPDDWIDKVFAVMALTPQHTYQVLTKRAKRMRDYMTADSGFGRWGYIEHQARKLANIPAGKTLSHFGTSYLPNAWLGVSAEDQARADERIPHLLATPAAVRFISAEPLLGAIDLRRIAAITQGHRVRALPPIISTDGQGPHLGPHLDWVIAGGESGFSARPSHPDWFRTLRDQCAAAGVPYFFKQWGSWAPEIDRDRDDPDWRRDYGVVNRKPDRFAILNLEGGCGFHGERVHLMARVGKKAAGAELDGKLHREFPT